MHPFLCSISLVRPAYFTTSMSVNKCMCNDSTVSIQLVEDCLMYIIHCRNLVQTRCKVIAVIIEIWFLDFIITYMVMYYLHLVCY